MDEMLITLEETLRQRQAAPTPGSYTARLLAMGESEILKKVGEEAIEVIIAAQTQGNERLVSETADLIYHLTVMLIQKQLSWVDIQSELKNRHHA